MINVYEMDIVVATVTDDVGIIEAGTYGYSVLNYGAVAGEFDGNVLPVGVSISPPALGYLCRYQEKSFDATGTTFLVIKVIRKGQTL